MRSNITRAGIARATIEGVLCGLLEGGDLLSRNGVPWNGRLILTGGAARSKAYRQILADLTGRSVWICSVTETAAAGAAVQAAAALTGTSTDEVAAAWAPRLEIAAEPIATDNTAVRQAYRNALAPLL